MDLHNTQNIHRCVAEGIGTFWLTFAGCGSAVIAAAFPEVGKKMLFLFDYGDEWLFTVGLIGLGRREPKAAYPRVVKQVGEAPPQYPDLEEDEEG